MSRMGRFPPTPTFSSLSKLICLSLLLWSFYLSAMTQFPPITVPSINCCSLNLSSVSSSHHKLKLYGITKLKSDIIFMSDIRLGSRSVGGSSSSILEKSFLMNPYGSYSFYYNSSRSSRGVGILIKKSLNFSVLKEARDLEENILGLRISISGTEIALISIYGPNSIDENFFKNLSNILSESGNVPAIIGGDWNCMYSCNNLNNNLDVQTPQLDSLKISPCIMREIFTIRPLLIFLSKQA